MNQSTFDIIIDRAKRVMQLDQPVFRTIARDPNATRQAAIVVGVVAIAGAIGGSPEGFGGVILGIVSAIIGWLIFTGLAWFFGTNIFARRHRYQLGVAAAHARQRRRPRTCSRVRIITILGGCGLVGAIWAFVTAIVAFRETLAFSTGRAIVTAIVASIDSPGDGHPRPGLRRPILPTVVVAASPSRSASVRASPGRSVARFRSTPQASFGIPPPPGPNLPRLLQSRIAPREVQRSWRNHSTHFPSMLLAHVRLDRRRVAAR